MGAAAMSSVRRVVIEVSDRSICMRFRMASSRDKGDEGKAGERRLGSMNRPGRDIPARAVGKG
jgi:hypothetical protein